MLLILVTVAFCVVTNTLGVSSFLAFAVLIPVAAAKGIYTDQLKHVFNFKKTKQLYKENGLYNSIMELLSLLLIFMNTFFIDVETLSLGSLIVGLIFLFLLYRFLFWGITNTIKSR
ncbi:hypothetical protein A374_07176 [Fictibacillus macauensis ZFHKF-1]|uniref:Uncharacterized protein n=1 Tax=Fictibacillus macauensis ZFHKF-1 TaxID=1196324 RepID=I8UH00_9BACL|nr:hypothetical protein [Fictibacillus macauensis]EIT86083.1 hypothetical protein A374_07176 [Fictibacillus macauensis ZFHKF-1]